MLCGCPFSAITKFVFLQKVYQLGDFGVESSDLNDPLRLIADSEFG